MHRLPRFTVVVPAKHAYQFVPDRPRRPAPPKTPEYTCTAGHHRFVASQRKQSLLPIRTPGVSLSIYALAPNTLTTPSPLTATSFFADAAHRTATAGTEFRNGSLHFLLDFAYCWTVMPDAPPVARYWPV